MPEAATDSGAARPDIGDIRIQDVVSIREQTLLEKMLASQAFWVTVALVIICLILTFFVPQASEFMTPANPA